MNAGHAIETVKVSKPCNFARRETVDSVVVGEDQNPLPDDQRLDDHRRKGADDDLCVAEQSRVVVEFGQQLVRAHRTALERQGVAGGELAVENDPLEIGRVKSVWTRPRMPPGVWPVDDPQVWSITFRDCPIEPLERAQLVEREGAAREQDVRPLVG